MAEIKMKNTPLCDSFFYATLVSSGAVYGLSLKSVIYLLKSNDSRDGSFRFALVTLIAAVVASIVCPLIILVLRVITKHNTSGEIHSRLFSVHSQLLWGELITAGLSTVAWFSISAAACLNYGSAMEIAIMVVSYLAAISYLAWFATMMLYLSRGTTFDVHVFQSENQGNARVQMGQANPVPDLAMALT